MADAAPLEIWKNVADKAAVAADDDQRLSPEALGRTARLAVAAWALAVNGDHATLTSLGPADVLYWLLHPVRKPWQVGPGPVVTRIDVRGLDPEATPPELDLSFRFTGRRRYDDRRQATGDPGGQAMFHGSFTMTLAGRGSSPWQLKTAHISTLDDYYGYVFTSRPETAGEFRARTGSDAVPARAGPPRTYRLVTGFAEHDERFGSSATADVQRDAPPEREEAAELLGPAIDAEMTRALGPGDWRPSMNWLDVVELLVPSGTDRADGMPETRVVNCVLLWARPGMEAALSAYEDKVLRLVAEHGGRVLERGTVRPSSQHDGEPPAEVQFLEMPSEASLDAYMNDPRRLAMAAERDAAIARTDLFRIQPAPGAAPRADPLRLS